MEELGLMEQSPVLHLDEWEIPRENIVLNRRLGEGAFGAVCGGEVLGLRGEGELVPVTVKSLLVLCLRTRYSSDQFRSSPYKNDMVDEISLLQKTWEARWPHG